MNFIGESKSEGTQRELKYCERCGGLFLRPLSTNTAYCTPCRAHWMKLIEANNIIKRKPSKSRMMGGRGRCSWTRKPLNIGTRTLRGCSVSEVSPC